MGKVEDVERSRESSFETCVGSLSKGFMRFPFIELPSYALLL
jgi:hypothetical protein